MKKLLKSGVKHEGTVRWISEFGTILLYAPEEEGTYSLYRTINDDGSWFFEWEEENEG